ncbi:hypothetical protein EJB05_45247, partial [Eragrostis curvula]
MVGPGRNYACLPASTEDKGGVWSLLVGFISSSATDNGFLGLHRLRVAASGRILGRSEDTLELLEDTLLPPQIRGATAMPTSDDGRSALCLFISEKPAVAGDPAVQRLRPLQLHLDLNAAAAESSRRRVTVFDTMPDVPLEPLMRTRPVFAAGRLWAPCFSEHFGPPRLLMKHLDEDAGGRWTWADVAAVNLPIERGEQIGGFAGRFLHGYAVVDGGTTILLSLQQPVLFVAFDCTTGTWAHVITAETSWEDSSHYLPNVPIRERGVYVEEDDTIYFLCGGTLFAYRLCRDEGRGEYRMAPPVEVACLCPLAQDEGYGFVTHLGGRLMCSVWIGVTLRCSCCDAKHVLITTFRVDDGGGHGQFVPIGVKVIHSTCRRLDISPGKPSESHCEFCFLQEYAEIDQKIQCCSRGQKLQPTVMWLNPPTICYLVAGNF